MRFEVKLATKGSLQVTEAKDPLNFSIIRRVPRKNVCSLGSQQKSLNEISFVVLSATLTVLLTIGGIISVIAERSACAIISYKFSPVSFSMGPNTLLSNTINYAIEGC